MTGNSLMNKCALTLAALILVGCNADDPPKGEGSYDAAERISKEILTIKAAGPSAPLPAGFYPFEFKGGGWYVATGTDSHAGNEGGTVGILTSEGEAAVFFMHVCGGGSTPLEFGGENPHEMMANLRKANSEYKRP